MQSRNMASDIKNWYKQLKYERVDLSSSNMEMHLEDGLSFANIDLNTNMVCPVRLMTTMLKSRSVFLFQSSETSSLIDFEHLKDNYFIFVVSGEMTVGEKCYDVSSPKWPAVLKHYLVSMRNTSLSLSTSLVLANSPGTTSNMTHNVVMVARDTRRPSPFPGWWREKYKSFFSDIPPKRFPDLVRPEELKCQGVICEPYTLTVARSNMDGYNHTTVSSYLQFSLDALDYHVFRTLSKTGSKKERPLLKRSLFSHKGESEIGDILSVALWEDEKMPGWICFQISKSGNLIYEAKMSFYNFPSVQSKL